ncbi:MAG: NAD(P)H-quinone oxidoreductase [Sulfobacillus sp.]|mgnify:CR=1 FL=1|nr:NAD(P)H-quinone oxidoreductase [Sulfobacillus sp.]
MKAIVLSRYGGPEVLQWQSVPDPVPGPEDLLVEIYAAGVNRADVLQRRGLYPPPEPRPTHEIPGLECAGVVRAVGERVLGFQPGDRVMALLSGGGYAEWVTVPYRLALPIPDRLSFVEAAAIPEVFLTAYDALFERAELQPGDTVLVHAGASGVGSAALQIARVSGITAWATAGSERKREAARAFGAEKVVNYRQEKFLERVQEWSGGRGVDAVLDFVGQDYLEDNLKVLAPEGVLVIIGTLSGPTAAINLGWLLSRRLTVRGTALRSRPPEQKMTLVQQFGQRMGPWLADGRLKPVIDQVFSRDEVGSAHEKMEANRNIGKLIIQVRT